MGDMEIKKILAILQPVWPPSGLDKLAVSAWTLALDGMDSGLLQAAAAEWVRTQKWMPKPFELITLAGEIEQQQMQDGIRSLPEPERVQLPVADAKRMIATLLQMGFKRAHPNLIAAAYGRPPTVLINTSEPIPGELIAELTRGAA